MNCGIYKITNTINNKVYVGSSINLKGREYKHFWMLEKGFHDNHYLQNSFDKYGKENFIFEIIDFCEHKQLISRENELIKFYGANNLDKGYNLALVNKSGRNTYNDEVKIKLSKYFLNKNGNILKYSLTNNQTNQEYIFETLVEGANYLIENGFAKGKPNNVRMAISNSLRGKKLNNGHNGSIRKTCYKHLFKIIN